MSFHDKDSVDTIKVLNSDLENGLSLQSFNNNLNVYGRNVLTKRKPKGILKKIFEALSEPMLIILSFGFIIAFAINLGKFLKSGEGDFLECVGILFAIVLSVSITLIMEGSSEKAFNALNKIYDNLRVKAIREGQIITIRQSDVVVGDIILLESGDKIIADGRLVESNSLSVDESALTGESNPVKKDAKVTLNAKTPLAERKNSVYSGTFVTFGSGKMIVTAVGDKTEIGNIAEALGENQNENSPLQQKLKKLGKTISTIGAITAIIVFVVSIFKLYFSGEFTFGGVQSLFISCIVLIVAAVPEGLPTIVAVSLALNMIKLARENALIKKMTATETIGAVSVICTDKTGTLTENKMRVESVCLNEFCTSKGEEYGELLRQNFICNSTADVIYKGKSKVFKGSPTECALIESFIKTTKNKDYLSYRKSFEVIKRTPFSSDTKMMTTIIKVNGMDRLLLKGAPEVVINKCNLTENQKEKIMIEVEKRQNKARRVLCFAHADEESKNELIYDGFVAIVDPIRKEVVNAVKYCKKAGIKTKILTGDNKVTAFAVAKELKLAEREDQVINAKEIEELSDEQLYKLLPKISVIARSTPATKLRIVKALKSMGEIVAVTGDGINDAPAIKYADVGIAMGINGSEITKEAADVVLLDDSFMTVVKAVSFGRNVYQNLQRFILFQLTVNFSALFFITVCAILGMESPFNTFQLLWINVIMDGPPALTLGLEKSSGDLLDEKPTKKDSGIVSGKMLLRIVSVGLFMGIILILQYFNNILSVPQSEKQSVIFTLFILFQLFNAFNSRELGVKSIFRNLHKNKIMLYTFMGVFFLHFLIVQVGYKIFSIAPMSIASWLKTLVLSSTIVTISELVKFLLKNKRKNKKA